MALIVVSQIYELKLVDMEHKKGKVLMRDLDFLFKEFALLTLFLGMLKCLRNMLPCMRIFVCELLIYLQRRIFIYNR